MSSFNLIYPSGATPLNPDEMNGLIPDYINTQEELNSLEQENILEAIEWAYRKKDVDVLNTSFSCSLHKKMFNQIWKWAGVFRTTNKNIGVHWTQIPIKLKNLFENTKYWVENNTYEWDELAIRFHHRLVSIHSFPNGNGRHARLMTDILSKSHDQTSFTWGGAIHQSSIEVEGKTRKMHIAALKKADLGDFSKLIDFAQN